VTDWSVFGGSWPQLWHIKAPLVDPTLRVGVVGPLAF
jgi:hypothetical protein